MLEPTEPTWVERLQGRVARALAALPPAVQRRLAGPPPPVADGVALDPTLHLLLRLHPQRGPNPLTRGTPEEARARLRRTLLALRAAPAPVAAVRELTVDGAEGPLPARLYVPDAGAARPPLLVYFHGGGHVLGDLDTVDEPCRLLCRHGRLAVLSVAYRLAPEHPAPAAVEDALAAFRWAHSEAAALGTDPARVAVGGDSAGGNLAAVVAQLARGEAAPVAQLLFYPPTDRTRPYASGALFDGYHLRAADRDAFHRLYTSGTDLRPEDPRVSPLRGTLHGVAPAYVVTAGFDVLRDEGEAYAAALREAGVPVEAHREGALTHGFLHFTPVCRAALEAVARHARGWRAFLDAHAPGTAEPPKPGAASLSASPPPGSP